MDKFYKAEMERISVSIRNPFPIPNPEPFLSNPKFFTLLLPRRERERVKAEGQLLPFRIKKQFVT